MSSAFSGSPNFRLPLSGEFSITKPSSQAYPLIRATEIQSQALFFRGQGEAHGWPRFSSPREALEKGGRRRSRSSRDHLARYGRKDLSAVCSGYVGSALQTRGAARFFRVRFVGKPFMIPGGNQPNPESNRQTLPRKQLRTRVPFFPFPFPSLPFPAC